MCVQDDVPSDTEWNRIWKRFLKSPEVMYKSRRVMGVRLPINTEKELYGEIAKNTRHLFARYIPQDWQIFFLTINVGSILRSNRNGALRFFYGSTNSSVLTRIRSSRKALPNLCKRLRAGEHTIDPENMLSITEDSSWQILSFCTLHYHCEKLGK